MNGIYIANILIILEKRIWKWNQRLVWIFYSPIFFSCNVGVLQGKNVSPFLFSVYVSDLKNFLIDKNISGLQCVAKTYRVWIVFFKFWIMYWYSFLCWQFCHSCRNAWWFTKRSKRIIFMLWNDTIRKRLINFRYENYLNILLFRKVFVKFHFRKSNHRLPIWNRCTFICNDNQKADEMHFVPECKAPSCIVQKYLEPRFYERPNTFQLCD